MSDRRFDVDLYIETDSRVMISAWMGYSNSTSEISRERIRLLGDALLARTIDTWLDKCTYAEVAGTSQ